MPDPDEIPAVPADSPPAGPSISDPGALAQEPAPTELDAQPKAADADPAPATLAEPAPAGSPVPGAGIRYALLRVLMLITVGGVLYLVGMRGWALLFTAFIASAIASFFVFRRQREDAARNLEASVAARRSGRTEG